VAVDLDGQNAHHVVMQTHQAFHFLHGVRRGVGAHVGVMALAVLVDLVGHRLDAPVFGADEVTAIVAEDRAEVLDQALGLRVGQVLTRNENMLVERHVISSSVTGAFQRPGV
jgi:hypothetical protein